MPHFIIEYSANLEQELDLAAFCDLVRRAAIDTGIFPVGGIRVRAHRCEFVSIADGTPDHAFIAVSLRLGAGRDLATRRQAGQSVFDAMANYLGAVFDARPLALSFDMRELDPDLSFKRNTIHERIAARAQPPGSRTDGE